MAGFASYFTWLLDWLRSLFWKEEMELCLLGLQNSGKTTIVNLMANGNFIEDSIPTMGFNMRKVIKGNVEMKVWDLGGQERFRPMWERYCRGVDCIVFVIDSVDTVKFELASSELHDLMAKPELAGIPILIVGNKNDLDGSLNTDQLIDTFKLKDIGNREVSCYSISAKSGNNIDLTLKWLAEHAGYAKKANKN